MTPDKLRELRHELGWSQTLTAERLGVNERTYKHYEAGTTSRGRETDAVPKAIAMTMLAFRYARDIEAMIEEEDC